MWVICRVAWRGILGASFTQRVYRGQLHTGLYLHIAVNTTDDDSHMKENVVMERYTTVQKFEVTKFFSLIFLFSKVALNWSNLAVKKCIMLSNFLLSFHHRIKKKYQSFRKTIKQQLFSALIIIRNQHIRTMWHRKAAENSSLP